MLSSCVTPPQSHPPVATLHAAGEPSDADIKLTIEHKDCLSAPDLGTNAGCVSVDGYDFGAIGRHGRLCQVENRVQVPTYPITMTVTATGHYSNNVDQDFSLPGEGLTPADETFMFTYSDYYHAWNYNVAPLTDASPCKPG